jgi:hypothetical protein
MKICLCVFQPIIAIFRGKFYSFRDIQIFPEDGHLWTKHVGTKLNTPLLYFLLYFIPYCFYCNK